MTSFPDTSLKGDEAGRNIFRTSPTREESGSFRSPDPYDEDEQHTPSSHRALLSASTTLLGENLLKSKSSSSPELDEDQKASIQNISTHSSVDRSPLSDPMTTPPLSPASSMLTGTSPPLLYGMNHLEQPVNRPPRVPNMQNQRQCEIMKATPRQSMIPSQIIRRQSHNRSYSAGDVSVLSALSDLSFSSLDSSGTIILPKRPWREPSSVIEKRVFGDDEIDPETLQSLQQPVLPDIDTCQQTENCDGGC